MPCIKKIFRTLIGVLTFLAFQPLSGQEVVFTDISYENIQGARQTIEGPFGYMWAWVNSSIFRLSPDKAEQISKNTQYPEYKGTERLQFFVDKNGLIWVLYGDALTRDMVNGFQTVHLDIIDPNTKEIIPISDYFKGQLPFDPKEVFSISQDHKGRLWIGTLNGQLYSFDQRFSFVFTLESRKAFSFASPAFNHHFWVASEEGVLEVDQSGIIRNINYLESGYRSFSVNENGGLLVAILRYKGQSTFYIKEETQPLYCFDFPDFIKLEGNSRIAFQDKMIWISATNFFGGWFPFSNRILDLTKEARSILENPNSYYQLYIDRKDQLWVNGYAQFLIALKENKFVIFEGASLRGITHFSDSLLWVNSYSSPFLFNKTNLSTQKLPLINDSVHKSKYLNAQLFGLGVTNDGSDYLWLGMEGNGLNRYNIGKKDFESFPLPAGLYDRRSIYPFLDSKNKLWVGLSHGLVYYLPELGKLLDLELVNKFTDFQNRYVQHIHENEEGLWLATDNGLYLLIDSVGLVAHYHDFPNNYIVHLFEDKEGVFWLSTRGGGVVRWNRKKHEIKQFLLGEKNEENEVHAVYGDGFGNLWIPTNSGLKHLDKETQEVKTFYQKDGIANNEFNFLSHYQDSDGTLYLGGVNGLTIFHPRDFQEALFSRSPLLLEKVLLQEKNGTWKEQEVSESKTKLVIPYSTRGLRFSFALLDFSASLPPHYFYRLEGYEEAWQNTTEGTSQYNRLPFGQYTLVIKGQGEHGEWSANTIEIPIQVLKPLYFQTWFILLGLLVLGLIGYGIALYRIANLEKNRLLLEVKVAERTKDLEELNQMKDRLFAILGHELRGPLVSFQNIAKSVSFLLKKKDYGRVEEIGSVIENTTIHINDLLDNLINWGLTQTNRLPHHPEMLDLPAVTEQVLALFEPMANSKGIALMRGIEGRTQLWADRNAILTILRNLVNNALKFTPSGGQVQIMVSGGKNTVKIAVKDTGVGMTKEQVDQLLNGLNQSTQGTDGEKGTGLGLALCAALAEQNKGKISIESALNHGTTVTILFWQKNAQT